MSTPLETLRHHVTGAIERGEAEAITQITAAEFQQMLHAMDWYFQFSDDHSAWLNGRAAQDRMDKVRATSPELEQMYQEYTSWYFDRSGTVEKPAWITWR